MSTTTETGTPEGPPALEQAPLFPILDTLRAVGALAVLTTHTAFQSGDYLGHGYLGTLLSRLDIGVAIFFVLSGFLLSRPFLARAAVGRPAPALGRYALKRVLRIFPVYAVSVVLALLLVPENDSATAATWLRSLLLRRHLRRPTAPARPDPDVEPRRRGGVLRRAAPPDVPRRGAARSATNVARRQRAAGHGGRQRRLGARACAPARPCRRRGSDDLAAGVPQLVRRRHRPRPGPRDPSVSRRATPDGAGPAPARRDAGGVLVDGPRPPPGRRHPGGRPGPSLRVDARRGADQACALRSGGGARGALRRLRGRGLVRTGDVVATPAPPRPHLLQHLLRPPARAAPGDGGDRIPALRWARTDDLGAHRDHLAWQPPRSSTGSSSAQRCGSPTGGSRAVSRRRSRTPR